MPKPKARPAPVPPAEPARTVAPPAPQIEAAPEPDPEHWTRHTPEPMFYDLLMHEPDGNWVQDVELTRAEFIALKRYLAGLRGLESSLEIEDVAA